MTSLNNIVLGERLVLNQELSAGNGIHITVIQQPRGLAILVRSITADVDYFLVWASYRLPGTEITFTRPVVVTNKGTYDYDYAALDIASETIVSIFVEPVRRVGPAAAFSVEGWLLEQGVIGLG